MSANAPKLAAARQSEPETEEVIDRKRAEGLARVGRLIARLQSSGYYGKVTVSMQNGKVVEVRTEQVLGLADF
jgi:hypothetical protein